MFQWNSDYSKDDLVSHFKRHGRDDTATHNGHTVDCIFCADVIRAGERLKWVHGQRAIGKVKAHRDCSMGMVRRYNPNPALRIVSILPERFRRRRRG